MSNRPPFSHPELENARSLLRELRNFAHPQLEDDEWAQRAACKAIDRIKKRMDDRVNSVTEPVEDIDWG